MSRYKAYLSAAASFLFVAAVGVLSGTHISAADEVSKEISAPVDTIRLCQVSADKPISFTLPEAPAEEFDNTFEFEADDLLDAVDPVAPGAALKGLEGFHVMQYEPGSMNKAEQDSTKKILTFRRYITKIRPDAFFKGKFIVKTPDMAKAFLNGKEILVKKSQDSEPKEVSANITLEPQMDGLVEIRLLSENSPEVPEILIVPDNESSDVELAYGPDLKSVYNVMTPSAGERISTVDLSPDGNYILVKATYSDDAVNFDSNYYVLDRRTLKKIAEAIPADAAWLKNREATLYFSEKSRKSGNTLTTLELPSLKRGVLASNVPEDATDGVMSPDGSYLIFYDMVEGEDEKGIMRRLNSIDGRIPSNKNNHYLSMYRFSEGVARPLTYGGPSTYLQDISPDSKKLLYAATRETPEKFPFYETVLVEMNVNTLATDTIRGIDSSLSDAGYSPDGKRLVITAGPNAFEGIGRNSGKFEWANDFDLQIYIADLKDGVISNVKPMTRDFDPAVSGVLEWNRSDNRIYFRAQDGYRNIMCELNPENGKIRKLSQEVDYVSSWTVSRNHPEYIAYTGLGLNYMGKAYLYDSKTGKTRLIDDPNAAYLSGIKTGRSDDWSFVCPVEAYKDSIDVEPTKIECTMTLPPDFDESESYPMIVYYYGGTIPSTKTNHSPYTPNLFASRGYVVLTLNPSGTTGYGQEFSARHVNAWGTRTADEIIYGVKKFCEEHPFVNKDKIGCIGASYGGFMTQYLLTQTDIFAAAVSHAGISNITSYWGEGYWGYSYNSVAAARSYPWSNPDLFTKHSPLFMADRINTPLLLLHGNRDTNVPIGESIQMYNALKLLDKEVEFITIDGSDHIVMDFEKRKEWHATIMAWFERWLRDDSRWWDELY